MEKNLEIIRDVIRKNDNIVLVSGSDVTRESGMNGVRAEHMVYDIEQEYGYSGEEIMTEQFFTRQVDVFYDYYKNIILGEREPSLTTVYRSAAQLEKSGKLTNIVTRMVYDSYAEAGCNKVIMLYGSVEENKCPACGKTFDSNYIRRAKHAPKCDSCQMILRPGFSLFGEMLDNTRLTQACNAIEYADVLLVVGTHLNSLTWQSMLRYYSGDKLILINTKENLGDERANYRAYGNISQIFGYITDYDE